jgi:hypothetical protein
VGRHPCSRTSTRDATAPSSCRSLGSCIASRQSDTASNDASGAQIRIPTTADTAAPTASHFQLSWKKLIT